MKLFEPYNLYGTSLSSRVIMAPLTRRRATRDHDPVEIMAEYYAQRASAGLIIAEGTSPSPNGTGYCNMPGLYNKTQQIGWEKVTSAVHEKGGKIFLQVMHNGRVGHQNNLPEGAKLLAPSPIAQKGEISTYDHGKQPYPVPNEMSIEDIEITIAEFTDNAQMSIEAGFDGIEIHGAHGYLPNQFLNQLSNKRNDEFGGSRQNRMRFLIEVIKACATKIGSHKVGLRISPFSYADSNEDPNELRELYTQLTSELNQFDLAYLHLSHMGDANPEKFNLWNSIRSLYKGNIILCGDFTMETAEEAIQANRADLIAFGRDYIANPDLVERMKNNWPLEDRDRTHWYTLGPEGYIDYPTFKKT